MGNDMHKQQNLQVRKNHHPVRQQAFADYNLIYMSGSTGPSGSNGNRGMSGPKGSRGMSGPNGPSGPKGRRGMSGMSGPSGATGMNNYIYSSSIKGYMVDDGIHKPYGMIEQVSCNNAVEPYCDQYSCIPQPYSVGYDTWKKQPKYTT